jgi:CheY-like chemotaxis protein
LKQILTNLITNAIKFTDKGHVSIDYRLHENETIEFIIQDTGIGIDEKYQKLIFERFSQVEGEMAIKQSGSGLGLAISKAYVTLLGGKIYVQSKLGKGSTFSFTIPLIMKSHKDSLSVPGRKSKREKSGGGLILVTEDDEFNYLLLSKILTDNNYQMVRAVNGQEAIDICVNNNNIILVLMDIKMPVMNGYDAAKQIKLINPSLPIVAQTAYALESDIKQIQQAGFAGHITKPIEKEKLLDMIESLV